MSSQAHSCCSKKLIQIIVINLTKLAPQKITWSCPARLLYSGQFYPTALHNFIIPSKRNETAKPEKQNSYFAPRRGCRWQQTDCSSFPALPPQFNWAAGWPGPDRPALHFTATQSGRAVTAHTARRHCSTPSPRVILAISSSVRNTAQLLTAAMSGPPQSLPVWVVSCHTSPVRLVERENKVTKMIKFATFSRWNRFVSDASPVGEDKDWGSRAEFRPLPHYLGGVWLEGVNFRGWIEGFITKSMNKEALLPFYATYFYFVMTELVDRSVPVRTLLNNTTRLNIWSHLPSYNWFQLITADTDISSHRSSMT